MLAELRWLIVINYFLAAINHPIALLSFMVLNIAIWWILLLFSIHFFFWGYFSHIRVWMNVVLYIVIGMAAFFVNLAGGYIISTLLYKILMLTPMVLLIYLCLRNYKKMQAFVNSWKYIVGTFFLLGNVVLDITLTIRGQAGLSFPIVLTYNMMYIVTQLLFTIIFSNMLGKRNQEYARSSRYKILFVGGFALVFVFTLLIKKDLLYMLTVAFMGMNLIILYELAESLFHPGDKFLRHKNAIIQFENEIRQNHRITNFLHDDILQDLFAAKLLTYNLADAGTVGKGIRELVDNLQERIRSEIESYGINIEKSMSYKENVDSMLSGIMKRYQGSGIEIYLRCENDIIISDPYDRIIYCMIKELVNNAFKHSGGTKCDIFLDVYNGKVILTVSNDGIVINQSEYEILSRGFGLASMKEQVYSLGGAFDLKKSLQGGMSVSIEL